MFIVSSYCPHHAKLRTTLQAYLLSFTVFGVRLQLVANVCFVCVCVCGAMLVLMDCVQTNALRFAQVCHVENKLTSKRHDETRFFFLGKGKLLFVHQTLLSLSKSSNVMYGVPKVTPQTLNVMVPTT